MLVEGFEFPEDRVYLKNHIWLKESDLITVGITQLGQSLSREIVHIDLPDEGETIKANDLLLAYETIKSVSQVSLPMDCVVESVNNELWDRPDIINENPYNIWILRIRGTMDQKTVMDANEAGRYFGQLIKKEKQRYAGY